MADVAVLGLELDATGVVRGSTQSKAALGEVTGAAHQTEGALGAATKAVLALGAAFGAYKAAQWAQDTLMLGARYETLGVTLDVVGKNAFKTSAEMAALQASLEKAGISMLEARSNLARMAAAELDLEQATQLARIAQDAAVIANTNSSESFERLITGISTGQTRILRTLGIFVDFNNALERGAKEMGKTAEALSEVESTQIRANAVLEAGTRIAGAYEAAMNTAGKQLNSTVRYLEDARVKASEAFQPAYTSAVFAYANALKFAGEHARGIAEALKILMALFAARVVAEATARLVAYNAQLVANRAASIAAAQAAGTLTAATTLTGRAMATAGTLAKGAWAAIGGPIGAAVIGALALNAVLDKYLAKLVAANELTAEEQALWEKTQKIWADREAAAAAAAQAERDRAAAQAEAAEKAAEKAKEAAKEARTLELELEHQAALVAAFGQAAEALDALNLEYERRAALAKNAEEYTGADLARLDELTNAVYAQRQALADLEAQQRRMEQATLPLVTGMGMVSDVAATEMALERELAARKALLAATLQGKAAVRELAIEEAGAAAAAMALAAGMPEAAERMREMAMEAARMDYAIQDAASASVASTDLVAEALRAMSSQLGGLAGDVGQVVTQFFLMAEAAQKAAGAAGKSLGLGGYIEAGAGAAGPAVAAMAANYVFGALGEMFRGRDEAEVRKVYEANTEALRDVAKNLEGFADRLTGMTSGQVGDFRDVLTWLQGAVGGYSTGGISSATLRGVGQFFGVDTSGKYDKEALIQLIQDVLAQAFRQVQERVMPDFAARAATLAGDDLGAARIRREAAAARELAELQKLADAGFITAEQMAEFARILDDELARAASDAAHAIEEEAAAAFREAEAAALAAARATRALVEDLTARALDLTGQGGAAATYRLGIRQRGEREAAAGESPEVRALLDLVHELERGDLARQQAIAGIEDGLHLQLAALEDQKAVLTDAWKAADAGLADQIELVEAAYRAEQDAYAEQIKTAKDALRTAQEQLRAQEKTVEELRNVVSNLADYRQSLLTSNLSPLSPVQQLEAARAEFERLASEAYGGSITAGQALPDAARTFLEISRRVNASGAGYQSDWAAVNATLEAAEGRFATQLSVEERMLNQLRAQTAQLDAQIAELQAAKDKAAADARGVIAELEAARKAARRTYEEEVARLEAEAARLRAEADAQIAAINAAWEEQLRLAREQLAALITQIGLLATIGTELTDQGGGQLPPPIIPGFQVDLGPTNERLDNLIDQVAAQGDGVQAQIGVLQAGFNSVVDRLGVLEGTIDGVGIEYRRAAE